MTNTENQAGLDPAVVTGTKAKPVVTDTGVLSKMEELYNEKLKAKNYWLQDLADAQGWWDPQGPNIGLQRRAQVRAAQDKDLQELQSAISTGKIGLSQLQEASGALQAPGQTTAPSTGGASTIAGGTTPAGWGTYRGVPVPPETYAAIQAQLRLGKLDKANEVFEKYAVEQAKFITNPGSYTQSSYWNGSETIPQSPIQIRGSVLGGTAPSAQAKPVAPSAPVERAPITPSAPVQQAPITTTPVSAVTPSADPYRFENLSADDLEKLKAAELKANLKGQVFDRPDAAENFNNKPAALRKAAFNMVGKSDIQTPIPKAGLARDEQMPSQNMSATVRQKFSSPQEEANYYAAEKQRQEKAQSEVGTAVGKRQVAIEEGGVNAKANLETANTIVNILDKTPGAVGISYRNPVTGVIMKGLESGAFPFVGKKNIEEMVKRGVLTEEELKNNQIFDSIAQRQGLQFRKDVMKGTGTVSDFETKLASKAQGLSEDHSAEANRFFAITAAENYKMQARMADAWRDYKTTHGKGADFSEFEGTKEFKRIQQDREDRVKKIFPDLTSTEIGFGEKKSVVKPTAQEEATWEKRYGSGAR